ncbi:hypothetical protein [Thalassotalea euphylliae]|uniref:Uncharacterized protein n=1 Tax=Thalassotalea euphylliae TaxID=1655234 RepID=A0A3E0U533_9GAMM|nr:hypothetical protein [Thalassotalea euphylliae]REL31295.1 hypothetical protein DXX94_11555 [Thalassotalea euphylliae]
MKLRLITLVVFYLYAISSVAIELIVKDDNDRGVKSVISLKHNNKTSDHGPTDENGQMEGLAQCQRGQKYHALPVLVQT